MHVRETIDYEGFLPDWTNHPADIHYDFMEKLGNITKTGYGAYARYNFFRLEDGRLVPVAHPDLDVYKRQLISSTPAAIRHVAAL